MKRTKVELLLIAGLMMASVPVHAQVVRVTGELCPMPVETEENGVVELKEFELYGLLDADHVLIQYDGKGASVNRAEFEALLPTIDLESYPTAEGKTNLPQGSRGDQVKNIQQILIDTGYLTGTADGSFGGKTADALRRFQADHRLEATGAADILTQMILETALDGRANKKLRITYPTVLTKEEKFANILDSVEVDLEPFVSTDWHLSYDKFAGTGRLDSGLTAGQVVVEGADIDRITLDASFKIMLVRAAKTGIIAFKPAIVVESTGAYRPYVQSAVFNRGTDLVTVSKGMVSTGDLNGASLTEFTYIPLTAAAVDFLAEGGDIDVRIKGKNQNYDFTLEVDEAKFNQFLAAAKGLLGA